MEELKSYLEERSEGVLRLLEGGKRRGLEEMKKGNGQGSQKELFQMVAATQRTFLEMHDRCRIALRSAQQDQVREIALDVQYLLYLFSCQVYKIAFANKNGGVAVTFPPPEAYSRHYPGSGPEGTESLMQFLRFFGETVYSREKSNMNMTGDLDLNRKDRLNTMLYATMSS